MVYALPIQKFSKSKTNHVGIIVSIWGELFIAEANGTDIDLVPFYKKIGSSYRIYRLPNTDFLKGRQIMLLQKSKYDKKSILRHFLFFIFKKWFGKDSKHSYNCVEFVAEILDFKDFDYSKVTPSQFESKLNSYYIGGNY